MRVIFVASKGIREGMAPVTNNQYIAVKNLLNGPIDTFLVASGLKNYWSSIFKLKKQLKLKKYDVIHAHYGLCGIIALLGRKRENILVSFMGDDLLGAVGRNGKYTLTSMLFSLLNVFLAEYFYDCVIVKSPNLLNKLKTKRHVFCVPNGVNIEKFYPLEKQISKEKIGLDKTKRYILFVSNPFRPEKNFKLAEQSVKQLKNKDLVLLTVKDIPNEKLVYYYNAADCLLLTSFHEGSPNVIKEAMACNCPIVATNVGDIEWVIGETEGCYLSSFNPEELASKIEMALKFSITNIRTNGRERIKELKLDEKTSANRIIDIYKKYYGKNKCAVSAE